MTEIVKRALVIGGGIAGIQAALDIADGGYDVVIVEKKPSIGGHMLQFSQVFPTLDCPQCIMTPKMVEVAQHTNITLLTYAEIESVKGEAGNFDVEILQKARMIDYSRCTGCGTCWQNCPEKVLSEFDDGIAERTAIYIPFAQAIPGKPVIDIEHCRYIRYRRFIDGESEGEKPPECRICEKLCQAGAIDWIQQPDVITEKFGAIIIATGFELMPVADIGEYTLDPDVVSGIQFERLLCPSGPNDGKVATSKGKVPKKVVFVSCAGSRDPEHGVPYCSRVCCMYIAKQATLYKYAVPDGEAHVFYIDVRSTGKGYEEFIQRAKEEGVVYLRGKVSRVFRDGDKLTVLGVDTIAGKTVEEQADMVVLGMAIKPARGIRELAAKMGVSTRDNGFIKEAHSRFNTLETSVRGIYLAGAAQGPKDIPDSVAQASGAAGKVLSLFSRDNIAVKEVVAG